MAEETVDELESGTPLTEGPEEPIRSSRSEADRMLVRGVLEGDEKAFEQLVKKYRKSVYYLIFKMVRNPDDAEDLTQEAFAKSFSSLNSFDPKFAFSTWLFRIATNSCIDFIRRQRMQTLSLSQGGSGGTDDSPQYFLQISDNDPIADETMSRDQRREYMTEAVNRLPERYRMLIELRYFRELSYEEVAAEMNIPLGTVKAQLHRARELLNHVMKSIEESL